LSAELSDIIVPCRIQKSRSDQRFVLGRSPVIRPLPIIHVPDPSNKRCVALTFRPIDRFSLRFEGTEYVARVVFDDIIVDMAPFRAPLGARFNVNVRHALLPLGSRGSF
jgi:hypothetical protein